METSVITFTIATTFDEWAKAYDGSLDLQRQAGITSLFRGAPRMTRPHASRYFRRRPGSWTNSWRPMPRWSRSPDMCSKAL